VCSVTVRRYPNGRSSYATAPSPRSGDAKARPRADETLQRPDPEPTPRLQRSRIAIACNRASRQLIAQALACRAPRSVRRDLRGRDGHGRPCVFSLTRAVDRLACRPQPAARRIAVDTKGAGGRREAWIQHGQTEIAGALRRAAPCRLQPQKIGDICCLGLEPARRSTRIGYGCCSRSRSRRSILHLRRGP
jgi:hypothetical protein